MGIGVLLAGWMVCINIQRTDAIYGIGGSIAQLGPIRSVWPYAGMDIDGVGPTTTRLRDGNTLLCSTASDTGLSSNSLIVYCDSGNSDCVRPCS
jgi:hypothetical protein